MKTKHWATALSIVIVLGAGAYFALKHKAARPPGPLSYDWQFADKSTTGQTRTQVTLLAGGNSYSVGSYDGTCQEQTTDYLEYEKAKVVCWFAGGGHEVGVFEVPGSSPTVKVGDIDEGSAETAGFRGNFMVVKTL